MSCIAALILDMGKPVKIIDMARQMIELSGFKPDIDIEVRITGLRPGEKLAFQYVTAAQAVAGARAQAAVLDKIRERMK